MWALPTLILDQDKAPTCTGDDLVTNDIEFKPSCPDEFKPHAHRVLSDLIATVWSEPALTLVQELVPTCTGDDLNI